jgi:hypothetical protein
MNADIVVLSRYPEIFAGFRDSVDRDAPELDKLVLWDNTPDIVPDGLNDKWISIWSHEPFAIAKNANKLWSDHFCEPDDLIYAGDDTRIIEPNTIQRLHDVAYSDPKIGIVAPCIKGHHHYPQSLEFTEEKFVPFVFIYLKREVIDSVGYMDERFTGYGFDDCDFCYRTRQAGFKIGFANKIMIEHGVDGHKYASTFRRVKSETELWHEDEENMKRFARKYGIEENRNAVWKFIYA